eukprot:1268400-Pleurochrysis_carterae.AAC.4
MRPSRHANRQRGRRSSERPSSLPPCTAVAMLARTMLHAEKKGGCSVLRQVSTLKGPQIAQAKTERLHEA